MPLAGLRRRNGHDTAAGLQEDDASARLPEHPALLGCLIWRRASPPSTVGGHQDLAGGREEAMWPITESDRLLGTLRCGSAAERRVCTRDAAPDEQTPVIQMTLFCARVHSP